MINTTATLTTLLTTFMESFDLKNWTVMRRCLKDELYTDYSAFRKTPPGMVLADNYVAQRKIGIGNLITHHHIFDITISETAGEVAGRCRYRIERFTHNQLVHYHTEGTYTFQFEHANHWVISSITQTVSHTEGDPSIHGKQT